MDWKECLIKRIVKEVNPEKDLIDSLIKSSENKLKSSDKLPLENFALTSKFILLYDSVRELLEALALREGYKIYNHECYVSFLKEILEDESNSERFDKIRSIRNKVHYYGEEISMKDALEIINKTKSLLKEIKNKLKWNQK